MRLSPQYHLDETLFKAMLRKLDFPRSHFAKDMAAYSGGQKKKVLIAKSLCEQAHLYIWDEPLNFTDIISRIQLEEMIQTYAPTMVVVEHVPASAGRSLPKRSSLNKLSILNRNSAKNN